MNNAARVVVPSLSSVPLQSRLGAEEALARIRHFVEDWRMRTRDKPGDFTDFERELHSLFHWGIA